MLIVIREVLVRAAKEELQIKDSTPKDAVSYQARFDLLPLLFNYLLPADHLLIADHFQDINA